MIQALLHGKLNRDLKRSPYDIEDLLTSVVFGSCKYIDYNEGLYVFLSQAIKYDQGISKKDEILKTLNNVDSVEYEFWPNWFINNEPVEKIELSESIEENTIRRGQPELLIKFKKTDKSENWLLVEAKLGSGKSSFPTNDGPVNDQLGKYWILLKEITKNLTDVTPIGILYVTKGLTVPRLDFEETQNELISKGKQPAPLYWISWRHFANCSVNDKLLEDAIYLLREKWQLYYTEMDKWPKLFKGEFKYAFHPNWSWESCTKTVNYIFNPSWQLLSYYDTIDWGYITNWKWPIIITHNKLQEGFSK